MLKLLLSIIGIISLLGRCEKIAPNAPPQLNVSDGTSETRPRLAGECSFRYTIVNTSSQLDSASQTEAIRAGFRLWQRMSPNVSFLEFSTTSRAILQVKYVPADAMMTKPVVVSAGLLPGEASVVSALHQNENGTYSILLDNKYAWNTNTLTRAVAYQTGVLLGMAASADRKSCMYSNLLNEKSTYSASDSLALKRLYTAPCGSYLPVSLTVAGPVTKIIKFDRQGTVQINASG